MKQGYPKTWQSYQAQLELLMARGMVVTDQPKALEYLERIGYYRLSGYWFGYAVGRSDWTNQTSCVDR